MKLSSAAITVAAISLLSSTHAAPLSFKNGEISGRLHHRRGSDSSEIATFSEDASRADKALEDLNMGFEPASRIFNFIKRQVSSGASLTSSNSPSTPEQSTGTTGTAGTSDTDLHTSLMSPNLEEYGFASEGGATTALAPVREVKE